VCVVRARVRERERKKEREGEGERVCCSVLRGRGRTSVLQCFETLGSYDCTRVCRRQLEYKLGLPSSCRHPDHASCRQLGSQGTLSPPHTCAVIRNYLSSQTRYCLPMSALSCACMNVRERKQNGDRERQSLSRGMREHGRWSTIVGQYALV